MQQLHARPDGTELVPKSDPRSEVISINPARMSGEPCFSGTRVPVKTLFEYLAEGDSLNVFLDAFDGVSRDKAVAALRLAGDHLMDGLPRP